MFPTGSDESMLKKLNTNLNKNAHFEVPARSVNLFRYMNTTNSFRECTVCLLFALVLSIMLEMFIIMLADSLRRIVTLCSMI